MIDKVRVRFAPSPTGQITLGNLRTVLFTYLFARHNQGKFILRIEDTDQKRKTNRGVEGVIETFAVTKLTVDEGPTPYGGKYGPYIQTKRLSIYKKYAQQLVDNGDAYYCFCTPGELENMRAKQKIKKQRIGYNGHCRSLSSDEINRNINEGQSYVIRLRIPPEGSTDFEDVIFGHIKFENKDIDDQVILKSNGIPTYHLAVVVDDHLMKITHITRADEWMVGTPKHLFIYNSLGWKPPKYAHFPMVLNPDGKGKLSKRNGNYSIIEYLRQGYTVSGIINYLALLGWSPELSVAHQDEIYTLSELTDYFSFKRVHRSGARFDQRKMESINGQWLRSMNDKEYIVNLEEWIKNIVQKDFVIDKNKESDKSLRILRTDCQQLLVKMKDSSFVDLISLVRERARTWNQVVTLLRFWYVEKFTYQNLPENLSTVFNKCVADKEELKVVVVTLKKALNSLDEWSQEPWEKTIRYLADQLSWNHGDLFMLLRIIIIGEKYSLPLRESMLAIGRTKSLNRFDLYVTSILTVD